MNSHTKETIRQQEIEVRNTYIRIYLSLGFSIVFIITGTLWYGAATDEFGKNAGMFGVIFGVIGMILSFSLLSWMRNATMESPT